MASPDRDRDPAAPPAGASRPAEPTDVGAMGHDGGRVGAAGEDDRPELSRAIDEDRMGRRQKWIDKFAEQQRIARQWIAFAEIADWCAVSVTRASSDAQEQARALAYDLLDRSARNGEFERAGYCQGQATPVRSKILYLDAFVALSGASPGFRLTREQLGYIDHIRDLPGDCYLPRERARQWLVAHNYPWPAHFDPMAETRTDIPAGTPKSPMVTHATQTVQAPLPRGEGALPAAPVDQPSTSEETGIERFAKWIFVQHGTGKTFEQLYDAARRDPALGKFTKADFQAAFQSVYATESHRPPATGWPLRSPYRERWSEAHG
jgi:hypothetical protein